LKSNIIIRNFVTNEFLIFKALFYGAKALDSVTIFLSRQLEQTAMDTGKIADNSNQIMKNYAFKYNEMPVFTVAEGIERRWIKTDNLMMVNIEFRDGPTTKPDPFHSHPHEQVSFLVEGEIYLFVEDDEKVHLKPGDKFAIPSRVLHTIQRLTPIVRLIDCFTPVREDFL
jgi:quercetin dioxygenase-like cupin family protein